MSGTENYQSLPQLFCSNMLSKVCMYIYVYYDMLVCKVEAKEKKTHFHIQSKTPSKKSVKTLFTINFFKKVHLQIDLFFEKTYMKKKVS